MENGNGSGSGSKKHHPNSTSNDNDPPPLNQDKILGFSDSFSSSSDSDSDSDPLELSKSEQDGLRLPGPDGISSPDDSDQAPEWSMISSSSQRSGTGLLLSPEVKSPPIQTMGRPMAGYESYDPNRIPSSVFAHKPATPGEWSVASNESLFSIHMRNNSFSRDHAILFGKSGELNRPDDEWNSLYSEPKSNDLNNVKSSLATVNESVAGSERMSAKECGVKDEAIETPKVMTKETGGYYNKEKMPKTTSPPRLSDESGNSSTSFAFPVLEIEGPVKAFSEKPLLQSSKSKSKPEPEKTSPETTPNAAETRWFSCFSCCPNCCRDIVFQK